MTIHDDIARHANGAIDFEFYRARATALRREGMRDNATRRTALKFMLFKAAVLGIFIVLAAVPRQQANDETRARAAAVAAAEHRIAERYAAQSLFRWPAGPRAETAAQLRERIEVLNNSDTQKWWDGYGKSPTRGQATAVAELRRQLDDARRATAMR